MKPLLITLLFMTTITISCRRSINDATGTVADVVKEEQNIFLSENIEDSLKSFATDAKRLLGDGVLSVIVSKPDNDGILLYFFYSKSLIALRLTPSTKNYRMVGLRDSGDEKILVQSSNITSADSIINEAALDSLQGERLYEVDEYKRHIPAPFINKQYKIVGKDSLLLIGSRTGGNRINN